MKPGKLHYGWIVIFMGLLTTIASHGFARMSYTIILPAMKDGLQRLTQIWTGTNEIMNLLIQHEYYKEVLAGSEEVRNFELDATSQDGDAEKCYTDGDMWKVHEG